MTRKEFAETIESFLQKHNIAPTTFGTMANKEPNFVFLIREGRECREATQERVLAFINRYEEQKND